MASLKIWKSSVILNFDFFSLSGERFYHTSCRHLRGICIATKSTKIMKVNLSLSINFEFPKRSQILFHFQTFKFLLDTSINGTNWLAEWKVPEPGFIYFRIELLYTYEQYTFQITLWLKILDWLHRSRVWLWKVKFQLPESQNSAYVSSSCDHRQDKTP